MMSDSNSVVAAEPGDGHLGEPPQCLQGQDEQQQHQEGGHHILQDLQRAAHEGVDLCVRGGTGLVAATTLVAARLTDGGRMSFIAGGSPLATGAE